MSVLKLLPVFVAFAGSVVAFAQNSVDDSDFDSRVTNPAYTSSHPKILLDRGHFNLTFAVGQSIDKNCAKFLETDGYDVSRNDGRFDAASLRSIRILIVAVPLGGSAGATQSKNAFTPEEVEVIASWVDRGGSLLLIFDHYPIAAAAETLANRFGVQVQLGLIADDLHDLEPVGCKCPGQTIEYSRKNGLLKQHPITEGRNPAERLERVVTFGGSSLSAPKAEHEFLRLADSARHVQYTRAAPADAKVRTAQGAAFHFGRGRVVMLADANVIATQVARFGSDAPTVRIGMGYPGADNRQLLLNIVHWLSGLLD